MKNSSGLTYQNYTPLNNNPKTTREKPVKLMYGSNNTLHTVDSVTSQKQPLKKSITRIENTKKSMKSDSQPKYQRSGNNHSSSSSTNKSLHF